MPINAFRLIRILRWLAEGRYTWLTTLVIFAALIISLRPHTTEPIIRLTGLVLQVLGIGTVIWGIHETRALFGHPSVLNKVGTWLKRFPLLRGNVTAALDGPISFAITAKGRAHTTHGPANPTVEARLVALEKNVTSIHERISQTQKEIDDEFQIIRGALEGEEQSRQVEHDAILKKLEVTGTGGLHISAIGALLLFMGVILSTAATEIAAALK